jgi:MFS transporter, DHA1 family, tetracycline resistance protein
VLQQGASGWRIETITHPVEGGKRMLVGQPGATVPAMDRPQPRLFPILLVNFIGALGFSILLPFLIFLVLEFGGNGFIYGLIGATYSAFQFLGAPLLGKWSDRIGRRPVLLVSQIGTLAAWALFLLALYLPLTEVATVGTVSLTIPLVLLFVARVLDGLTGGNISVANAYLADVSTPETRRANFGRMGMAASLGFMIGPAIGGLLGGTEFGYALPVAAALGISALASTVIAFGLPEPPHDERRTPPEDLGLRRVLGQEHKDCFERPAKQRPGLRDVLGQPLLRGLLGINFVSFVAFNLFFVGFPVHAGSGLSWSPEEMGAYFAMISGVGIVAQGPLLTWLSSRASERALFVGGTCLLVVTFGLMTSPSLPLLFAAGVLFAVGNGVSWPSFQALLTGAADPEEQGAVQGYSTSVGSLASVLGLIVGGVLYGILGSMLFAVVAALFGLVALGAMRLPRPGVRTTRETERGVIMEEDGAEIAALDWAVVRSVATITDTRVGFGHRANGLGDQLLKAAVDASRAHRWRLHAACPYARAWLESHPDAADVLVLDGA